MTFDYSDDLAPDAIDDAVQTHARWLEYELIAAWRMDYDYVHVYDPLPGTQADFMVQRWLWPTDREEPITDFTDRRYTFTFDLTSVTTAEVRALLAQQ